MPSKPKRPCAALGCRELTSERYCPVHEQEHRLERERARGSAHQRGYTKRWARYSKWFLSQPENVFCKLQFDGCSNLSACVDHIAPAEPNTEKFFDPANHQAACIRCNSIKGRRHMVGQGKPFEANTRG